MRAGLPAVCCDAAAIDVESADGPVDSAAICGD